MTKKTQVKVEEKISLQVVEKTQEEIKLARIETVKGMIIPSKPLFKKQEDTAEVCEMTKYGFYS